MEIVAISLLMHIFPIFGMEQEIVLPEVIPHQSFVVYQHLPKPSECRIIVYNKVSKRFSHYAIEKDEVCILTFNRKIYSPEGFKFNRTKVNQSYVDELIHSLIQNQHEIIDIASFPKDVHS